MQISNPANFKLNAMRPNESTNAGTFPRLEVSVGLSDLLPWSACSSVFE